MVDFDDRKRKICDLDPSLYINPEKKKKFHPSYRDISRRISKILSNETSRPCLRPPQNPSLVRGDANPVRNLQRDRLIPSRFS